MGRIQRLRVARVEETGRWHEARYFYDSFGRRIGKDVDGVRTVFGWDGDQLAYESNEGGATQYVYEPETFVPLAQYVTAQPVAGIQTPVWQEGEPYVPEKDPLQRMPERQSDAHLFYYHCDQIGTPLLMTDEVGEVVWEASYRAWGEARDVIARVSKAAGVEPRNPIRFQGQQEDAETGLRYNRYRYYDPTSGRFVSKDPIGLDGGINVYQYAPNPTGWIDPLGLARCPCDCLKKGNPEGNGPYRGGSKGGVSRPGVDGHHMPADAVTSSQDGYLGYRDGPAIAMDPNDHKGTSSYKNSTAARQYRDKLAGMIASGNYRGAMATEILDIRRVARTAGDPIRYNTAMQEMLAYAKCRGLLKK
ncbi:putative deoxyribonuclease RhsC [Burkholderia cenocepacia]|nr:putative deoxyribonuclease RhsC [Burkholderia cenocepacia]